MREIKENLPQSMWVKNNLRNQKEFLFNMVVDSVRSFKPITEESYKDNPIQLIDFFSGAGGTSLGFAALNNVIPAFKMLGGCDINKISAQTYSHIEKPVSSSYSSVIAGIKTKGKQK